MLHRLSSIVGVPAESGQLHDQNHLCARDIHRARIGLDLAIDVGDRHVAHEKHKAYPWHVRAFDKTADGVGANC